MTNKAGVIAGAMAGRFVIAGVITKIITRHCERAQRAKQSRNHEMASVVTLPRHDRPACHREGNYKNNNMSSRAGAASEAIPELTGDCFAALH